MMVEKLRHLSSSTIFQIVFVELLISIMLFVEGNTQSSGNPFPSAHLHKQFASPIIGKI